jgi:serpin B
MAAASFLPWRSLTTMPKRALPLSLIAGLLLGACGDNTASQHPDAPRGVELAQSKLTRVSTPSTANLSALGADNRAFAFALLQQIASANPDQNLVLSPYSVSTALAMTYAAARGTTAEQMQTTLHFTLDQPQLHEAFNAADLALASRGQAAVGADGTAFRLDVSNALWAQRGSPIEPPFLDTLALNYGAGVFLADFAKSPEAARGSINRWVSDQTEQLIPELLRAGTIKSNTRFVLTNTVYFNAGWETKFDQASTSDAAFTKLDGSQVMAPLMHNSFAVPYAQGSGYQAVALPYASDELAFVAVLPDPGTYPKLEAGLSAAWFDTLDSQWSMAQVAVALPKLDYKAQMSLKPQLIALGMSAPFGGDADFSGLSSEPVLIDDVIHEAVLKVFEGGTIAAAATAVTFQRKSGVSSDHTLNFDHPFFFAILDRPSGELLFVGRVLDPSAH